MTEKMTLTEGEAKTIWDRITKVQRPKNLSAIDSLRLLHKERPFRVSFEIGRLKQPHLYIELEALPC